MSQEFLIARDELPADGRPLSFERESTWVDALLPDGIFRAAGSATFEGVARRVGDDQVVVALDVVMPLHFDCSRCGEEATLAYAVAVRHLFVSGQDDTLSLPVDVELDPEVDISEGVGARFDSEPAVTGALAADLPAWPVCSGSCAGPPDLAGAADEPTIDPRLAPLLAIRERLAEASDPDAKRA